jgi:hypothetical protein
MGKGITRYECKCGGEVTEEWDWYGTSYHCDKCDNPKPANGEDREINFKNND